MRIPFPPCCFEHYGKKVAKWPSFDDMVDWPEEGEEALYRYFTVLGDSLYELTATDPPLHYSIYKLPTGEDDERELVKQYPWEGEDQRERLANFRARFPLELK